MPRTKKIEENIVEEKPVVGKPLIEVFAEPEVVEEVVVQETKPRKHIIQIKQRKELSAYNTHIDVQVGEVIYWESTDDITYDYEIGYQIYMDNFVNRAIEIAPNKWVPREKVREWHENLPNATLIDGFFACEVLSIYENE